MAQLDLLDVVSTSPTVPFTAPSTYSPPDNPMHMTASAPSAKAEGAYKTISEVAEELDVPTHVLRFWESRFPQVKPQRMRGGRRYYRPADVEVLKKIKTLLYSQGYTIKGAKKHVKDKTHEIHVMYDMEAEDIARQHPVSMVSEGPDRVAETAANAIATPVAAQEVVSTVAAASEGTVPEMPIATPPRRNSKEIQSLIAELRELKQSLQVFS